MTNFKVKILGIEWGIYYVKSQLDFPNNYGQDTVNNLLFGITDFYNKKIYIALNTIRSVDGEYLAISTIEVNKTVLHELVHAYLDAMGHIEDSRDEALVSTLENMLYYIIEVDKTYEKINSKRKR